MSAGEPEIRNRLDVVARNVLRVVEPVTVEQKNQGRYRPRKAYLKVCFKEVLKYKIHK